MKKLLLLLLLLPLLACEQSEFEQTTALVETGNAISKYSDRIVDVVEKIKSLEEAYWLEKSCNASGCENPQKLILFFGYGNENNYVNCSSIVKAWNGNHPLFN